MDPKNGPVLPGALKALCSLLGWSWGDFARALGLSRNTLHRIEKGLSHLSDEKQEEARAILGVTPEEFEAAVHLATLLFERKTSGTAPPAPGSRRARLARQFEAAVRDGRAFLEKKVRAVEVQEAKEEAEKLWQELATRPQKERLVRVETCDEFLTPAFIARLCDESVDRAARNPSDSVEVGELALKVAELAPGTERQRAGRLAHAWAFVGNARRVNNEPGKADLAFTSSRAWAALGAGEEPEFFDSSRPLDLEASLRRDQGRFGEALILLDKALQTCWPSARSRILLNRAAALEREGAPEKALADLAEARTAIERGEGGPRYRWMLLFNMVKCLVHLERGDEAEARLPEVQVLAAEIGNDLDRLRLRVLRGEILGLTGRRAEALAELETARRDFDRRSLPADSAVVGLSEAAILLGEGRNAEVRALARRMLPTFDALGLERESLATVRLFLETVERDAATAALAREAARSICRLPRRAR